MTLCPKCQYQNPNTVSYCLNCGKKLVKPVEQKSLNYCPFCGTTLQTGVRFCTQCGKELLLAKPIEIQQEIVPQPQPISYQPPYKSPKRKRYGKIIGVIAVCIVVILVGYIVIGGFIKGFPRGGWQKPSTPGGEQYTNPNDWDNDGIPNSWETEHRLNPKDSTDAGLDYDRDGLTNLQEYDLYSNINTPELFIELDYLSGYKPNQDVLNYLTTYYAGLKTERYPNGITVHIAVDDNITTSQLRAIGVTPEALSPSECIKIEASFHDEPNICVYVFYAKSFDEKALGLASNSGAFLALQKIYDCADEDNWYAWLVGDVTREELEQVILLHEVGHCVNILDEDSSGNELYCSIEECAMNYADNSNWEGTNADGRCTYCFHHANQIDLTRKYSVNTYTTTTQWSIGSYISGGLRGYYYDNSDFTNFKFNRVDSTINFDWGDSAPPRLTSTDHFSIGWKGKIKIPSADDYKFYVSTDDGVRLWIDGKLAIDEWHTVWWEEEYGVEMYFSGSGLCDVEIEYYESTGDTAVKLYWESSTISKQIIPSSNLYYLSS